MVQVSPANMSTAPPNAANAYGSMKKDWLYCGGLCCINSYIALPCFPNAPLCNTDFMTQCCIAADSSAIPANPNHPSVCSCCCLPCCICYPSIGCCETPRSVYSKIVGGEEMLAKMNPKKVDALIYCGCCLPCGLQQITYYCISPYALYSDEGSTMCCFGGDSSVPCTGSIPKTCGYFGKMCWHGDEPVPDGCCVKMGEAFPNRFMPDAPPAAFSAPPAAPPPPA